MNTALDFAGNLAELFSWIGLGLGLVCLLLWLMVRSASGRWIATDAEVIDAAGSPTLRWMSSEGLHERALSAAEAAQCDPAERVRLFYSQHAPDRIRYERVGHVENTLRLVAGLLLGLGALALIASIVVLFIEV